MTEDTRTFTNVSRARVDRLRESIATFVPIPQGDTGVIEGSGVKGSFVYDEPAQTLTLSILDAPFFIPRAMIWSRVEQALEE